MPSVAVLVEQNYQELEVWYPVYRLREAGHTVHLIGPEAGRSYPSKLGYPATADFAPAPGARRGLRRARDPRRVRPGLPPAE